jgi:hypothetical protein
MYAVNEDLHNVIELLIEYGADLNISRADDMTILDLCGDKEMREFLISQGASPYAGFIFWDDIKEQIEYVEGLDVNKRKSIIEYTFDSYRINNYFRDQHDMLWEYENYAWDLWRLFLDAPVLKSNIVVYRFQKLELGEIGDVIWVDTFVSTSAVNSLETFIKNPILDSFLEDMDVCCLYVINVFRGSRILPVASISATPHEREILLQPDGILEVVSTDYTEIGSGVSERAVREMKVLYVNYYPPL